MEVDCSRPDLEGTSWRWLLLALAPITLLVSTTFGPFEPRSCWRSDFWVPSTTACHMHSYSFAKGIFSTLYPSVSQRAHQSISSIYLWIGCTLVQVRTNWISHIPQTSPAVPLSCLWWTIEWLCPVCSLGRILQCSRKWGRSRCWVTIPTWHGEGCNPSIRNWLLIESPICWLADVTYW
jgi:hypothetical protein